MKLIPFFLAGLLLFSACTGQNKIIFRPDPAPERLPEQQEAVESWQLIESHNGPAGAFLPEWVNSFLDGGVREVEALDHYQDKYIFVGENQGTNFNALRQWADKYTVAQDMPRLVARRVEQRLTSAASLYPDDEYGDYFARLIRNVSNAEYTGAVKADTFWIKRRINVDSGTVPDSAEMPQQAFIDPERYEFFVLISMDKASLQTLIQELMAGVKTTVPPTKEQTASINRIQHLFFEGF